MVVLTGGEPLLRRDLEEMVAHGSALGLSMVVGTNGVLLSERRVKSLQAAGVMGMGISLDSLDPGSGMTNSAATPGAGKKPWRGWKPAAATACPSRCIFPSPRKTRRNQAP